MSPMKRPRRNKRRMVRTNKKAARFQRKQAQVAQKPTVAPAVEVAPVAATVETPAPEISVAAPVSAPVETPVVAETPVAPAPEAASVVAEPAAPVDETPAQ